MRHGNSVSPPPQLPFLDVCNGEKHVTGFASAAEKSAYWTLNLRIDPSAKGRVRGNTAK
jgi:hypothetical protein